MHTYWRHRACGHWSGTPFLTGNHRHKKTFGFRDTWLEMETLRRRHTQVFEATMMERRCEVESTSAGSRSTSAPLLSTADP